MAALALTFLGQVSGAAAATNPSAGSVPSSALRGVVPLEWSFRNAGIPAAEWPTNSNEVIGFVIAGGHVQYFYQRPSPFREMQRSLNGFWTSMQSRLGISNMAGRAAAPRKARITTAPQPDTGFWGIWAELILRVAERWRFVPVTLLVIAVLWGVHRRHLRRHAAPTAPDPARFKASMDFSPWSRLPPPPEEEPPPCTLPKGVRRRAA